MANCWSSFFIILGPFHFTCNPPSVSPIGCALVGCVLHWGWETALHPPKSRGFIIDSSEYFGGNGIARWPSSSQPQRVHIRRRSALRRRKGCTQAFFLISSVCTSEEKGQAFLLAMWVCTSEEEGHAFLLATSVCTSEDDGQALLLTTPASTCLQLCVLQGGRSALACSICLTCVAGRSVDLNSR